MTPLSSGTEPLPHRRFEIRNVPVIDQYAESLPTGCELTSATMLIQWLFLTHSHNDSDMPVPTPVQVAHMVDKEPLPSLQNSLLLGGNPFRAMVGDPFDRSGFGMFHSAMTRLLDGKLLQETPWKSVDHTGKTLREVLRELVDGGIPVITWTTLKQREPKVTDQWMDFQDSTRQITWKSPEHAVLLVGYDLDEESGDTGGRGVVLVNDPDTGRQERYDLDTFEKRFEAIGKQAVSVKRKDDE